MVMAHMTVSSTMLILNKAVLKNIPVATIVLLAQVGSSAIILWVLGKMNVIAVDGFKISTARSFLWNAVAFMVLLYTNAKALESANLETVIVFRTLSIFATAYGDFRLLHAKALDLHSIGSLLLVVLGAVGYMASDKGFQVRNMAWVFAYGFSNAAYPIVTKLVIKSNVSMTSWGRTYYNNLMTFIVFVPAAFLAGEHRKLMEVYDQAATTTSLGLLFLSCVWGTAISFLGFLVLENVSATTFNVMGNANKILTMVLNHVIWEFHASIQANMFLLLSLVGAAAYGNSKPMEDSKEGGEGGGGGMFLTKALFSNHMNEQKMQDEQQTITTHEEAFRRIKDATGVADVNEVIQKFLTQDETHNNLVIMTKEAQARIDALNEEKAQLKGKVEEIKYSGTGTLGSRRIVDEFESHLAEANSKCERNKQKYERIARVLINVKSGVEHLADKLEPISLDQDVVAMTDTTVVEVLEQCEAKLVRLMQGVEGDTQQSAAEAELSATDKLGASQEVEMPAYNIRIQIPHDADDDSGEEGAEEDDQEDVPDRDQVKKYSSLMLEKANKKQKRQRKRKVGEGGSKSGSKKPDLA
mmetsp:Transcript_3540/g.10329  ORF Transcript_3540/g.10329 Transcript_3540/m.10329 type:complete len:583 (-) Transcript_3540:6-1754(-)